VGAARVVQYAGVWIVGGKPIVDLGDALRGLCSFQRRRIAQIIKRTTRVGFQITQGFVFAGEVFQHPRQQRMFVHIRQIARVIDVLIAQHGAAFMPAPPLRS